MAGWAKCATVGLITVFGWIAASGAGAECGAYEDAERASYRALTLEDFAGEPPREKARPKDRNATAILISTSIRVDELAVEVSKAASGGFVARPGALCVRAYLLKLESGRRRDAKAAWDVRHEQGHLDLTQARALELRARLAALTHTASSAAAAERGLRDAAARLYRDALEKCQAAQDLYDRETRHGNHRSAQGRWTEELAAELAGTSDTTVASAD